MLPCMQSSQVRIVTAAWLGVPSLEDVAMNDLETVVQDPVETSYLFRGEEQKQQGCTQKSTFTNAVLL